MDLLTTITERFRSDMSSEVAKRALEVNQSGAESKCAFAKFIGFVNRNNIIYKRSYIFRFGKLFFLSQKIRQTAQSLEFFLGPYLKGECLNK